MAAASTSRDPNYDSEIDLLEGLDDQYQGNRIPCFDPLCSSAFSSRAHLIRHAKTHHGMRPERGEWLPLGHDEKDALCDKLRACQKRLRARRMAHRAALGADPQQPR